MTGRGEAVHLDPRSGPAPGVRPAAAGPGPDGEVRLRVVVDMAADLFHAGHVAFLQKVRARFPGAHLTVWLHTDDQILSYKGRRPVMDFACRTAVLEACRLVDRVTPAPDEFTSDALAPFDVLCHGDDVDRFGAGERERFYGAAAREGKLVTVPYTEGISTTDLIERCKRTP
jgi:cytidyltransferase-like protein